jgi:hypothetical protein
LVRQAAAKPEFVREELVLDHHATPPLMCTAGFRFLGAASPLKADIVNFARNVRFVPLADIDQTMRPGTS